MQRAADQRIVEGGEKALAARRQATGMAAQQLDEQELHHAAQDDLGARRQGIDLGQKLADGPGDARPDGFIAGAPESVTWRLAVDILRREAGGGAQPVINGVSGLALSYFDASDAPTTIPSAVRSVEVRLTTRPDHAAPAAHP